MRFNAMRGMAAGAAALAAMTLGAGTAMAAGGRVVVDSTAMRERLERALENLDRVETTAKGKGKGKKEIRAGVDATRGEIEAALDVLGAAEPAAPAAAMTAKSTPVDTGTLVYRSGAGLVAVPASGAPSGAAVLKPFGAKKVDSLLREISLRDSLEEKRDLVARRAEKYYFSSAECETIVRAFDFDKDRAMVAEILWPVVIDPTNFGRVIDVLGPGKQKNRLKTAIGWTR
ncbi:MAG TPA: DUF4476 domain-containing protein [Myxococcota bacterium]|jgi:hypothetical protein|nr:DUF4476 domain-containing protein [Myxococcota bacterium]